MHPAAEKELAKLLDFIDGGKLPESAIPRLFYCGHTMLRRILAESLYRCVDCGKETREGEVPCACGSRNVYNIARSSQAEWECVECKNQWISDDGTKCPKCGAVKNA